MSDEPRLPSHLWIMAGIRRANAAGTPAMLRHRGEAAGGLLLLKVDRLDGTALLYTQQRDLDGRLGWALVPRDEPLPAGDAEEYIARARRRDPDLWVVEIEDRTGKNCFSETS